MRLTNKQRIAIALVALLTLAVGIACGIVLQRHHIPDYTLQKCLGAYQVIVTDNNDETPGKSWPGTLILETRRFEPSLKEETYDTEKDSGYTSQQRLLDLSKTALIVIDAWEYHPNDGWLKRARENMKLKLQPLLELAREHNMLIMHAPHGQETAGIAQPLQSE